MTNYDIAIIGGGPAGMMAAITSRQNSDNLKIIILEKNDTLGKKLLLTGGGRCNITNAMPITKQLEYYKQKNFLKHSLHSLDNESLLDFFKEYGLEFKEEENGRIFPTTDKSISILNTLKDIISTLNIKTSLNTTVKKIEKTNTKFKIQTNKETITADKVIITTGGITYPQTGSNGDGYKFAKELGHSISQIKPGLTSFIIKNKLLQNLAGITFYDVEVSFKNKKKRIKTYGNVLINHQGLTGPAILNLSNKIMDLQDYDLLTDKTQFQELDISIDFIPNLSEEELNEKIINDTPKYGTTKIKNYMKFYLVNNFIESFLNETGVSTTKTISNLTKKDKNKIIQNLKHFQLTVKDIDIITAKLTIGGVNIKEINSKTLESKIIPNLYFAGEILEPTGPTGGYNLQIAFSTGYLAGKSSVS